MSHSVYVSLSILVLSLSGCVSVPKSGSTNQTPQVLSKVESAVPGEFAHDFYVCRPSSMIRSIEKPDVLIDGTANGELENGSKRRYSVRAGKKFSLFLPSSFLMYRFNDETLFSVQAEAQKVTYLIVSPQANWAQGLSIYFGGAIAESVRQTEQKKSDNWTVAQVDKAMYEKVCSDLSQSAN